MIAFSFLEKKICNLQGKSILVDGIAFDVYQIMNLPVPVEKQIKGGKVVMGILVAMFAGITISVGYFLNCDPGNDASAIRVFIAYLVLLDLSLVCLIAGCIQGNRIRRAARGIWLINEGKMFAVELDDDPDLENRLKELGRPSRIFSRYPYMSRPPVRKLYVGLIVTILVFLVMQLSGRGISLGITCLTAFFAGLFACIGIVARQRFREQRWKT